MSLLFAQLRRSRTRGGRYVAAAAIVAYLAAAWAPCASAASGAPRGAGAVPERVSHLHDAHTEHLVHTGHAEHAAHPHHDIAGANAAAHLAHAASGDEAAGERGSHCPHCPDGVASGVAIAHDGVHATCSATAALVDLAALQSNDDLPSYFVPIESAAFTWPPPLASPLAPPPERAELVPSVPLNVRHCVFLI